MANQYFTLGGKTSASFHVGLSGSGTYRSSERDIKAVHVEGRNGDLLVDNKAFMNRQIVYPCWIAHTFKTDFDAFRSWLMQYTDDYYMLSDTYHPDHFFMARVVGAIEPAVSVMGRVGQFDVVFDCKPQWFRTDGWSYRNVPAGTLVNPTNHPARPVLRILGKGTVTINGQKIVVKSDMPYVDTVTSQPAVRIDCDDMDAFALTDSVSDVKENCNKYVEMPLDYIELQPGENTITLSGCKLEMQPRWYDL